MGHAWKPTSGGEQIVGTVTDKRLVETRYGERGLVEVDGGTMIKRSMWLVPGSDRRLPAVMLTQSLDLFD